MEQNLHMDEQFIEKKFEQDARAIERDYGEYVESAAETFNAEYSKVGREWSVHDTVGLGNYLRTWESYAEMFNEDATTRDNLGD